MQAESLHSFSRPSPIPGRRTTDPSTPIPGTAKVSPSVPPPLFGIQLLMISTADWKKHHHEKWGSLYEAKDAVVEWHTPTEPEIDFALELLRDVVVPALDTLEGLIAGMKGSTVAPSPIWTNDFCRFCNLVRSALSGIPSLIWLGTPEVLGQVASDAGWVPSPLFRPLAGY